MALKTVTIPITGQEFGFPSTEVKDRANFGKNVRVVDGVISQRAGHNTFGLGVMSGAVTHIGRYQQNDTTLNILRSDATKTNVYNASTGAWDDITYASSDWTGTEGVDYLDSIVFNNKVLMTNGIDAIQQYTGTGNCTLLGGSPPKAKYMEHFGEYVVLGHIIDGGTTYPYRIQWCDTGDEIDWASGNAGSFDLADDNSIIIGMAKLNEFLVVYKERSIYIGRLVNSISTFGFSLQKTGIGLVNNRCVIEHNGIHYFLARDGNIYAFNGIRTEPIGNSIRTRIFSSLNSNRLGVNFAKKNIYDRTIDFHIATGSSDWPNQIWRISYDDGSIFVDDINGITCGDFYKDPSSSINSWDSDTSSWDSDTSRWNEALDGIGFEFPLLGTSIGTTVKELTTDLDDVNTAIDQQFITKDFHFGERKRNKRWQQIEFLASGIAVDVDYSINFGLTWQHVSCFPLTSSIENYIGYFDVISPYIRFRWRNQNVGEFFKLQEFSIDGIIKERLRI